MTKSITASILAMAMLSQPATAQLRHDVTASAVAARGAEVRASITLALGSRAQLRREAQPLRLDLMAGPSMRLDDGRPLGRSGLLQGEGLRLRFAPGHSTRLSIGGAPVATHYANARVAAAEAGESGGGGVSGWAIAGGVVVVALGAAYLALEDAIDCTENGDYICE